ncbi:MAG: hypothetical protein V9F04_01310 [Dermatophilaceae bacterium]
MQLARLASVLHYGGTLDPSLLHQLIAEDKIADVHRYIDRVNEERPTADITMRGYVISLDGEEGFKKKYGEVPLSVPTPATDLGATRLHHRRRLLNHARHRPNGGNPNTTAGDGNSPSLSLPLRTSPRPRPSPVPNPLRRHRRPLPLA